MMPRVRRVSAAGERAGQAKSKASRPEQVGDRRRRERIQHAVEAAHCRSEEARNHQPPQTDRHITKNESQEDRTVAVVREPRQDRSVYLFFSPQQQTDDQKEQHDRPTKKIGENDSPRRFARCSAGQHALCQILIGAECGDHEDGETDE